MDRMNGKCAVVTRGTKGIGEACVRAFVREGASVIFTGKNEEPGLALQNELGAKAKFMKQDVSSSSHWEKVISETESTFGPVNVLVNNAAYGFLKDLVDVIEAEYRQVFEANQLPVFLGMRAVVASMKKVKGGSIVNLSSIGGLVAMPQSIAYGATKYAVRGMTKDAALEFVDFNIRGNSVHPGFIKTPMLEGLPPPKKRKGLQGMFQ